MDETITGMSPLRQRVAFALLIVGVVLMLGMACTASSDRSETVSPTDPTDTQQDAEAGQTGQDSEGEAVSPPPTPDELLASEDAKEPSAGITPTEIPEDTRAQVLDAIATDLNQSASELTIEAITSETWPDGCLGLTSEGEFCTMALIDGWRIQVLTGETVVTYRTNLAGTLVRREP